MRLNMNGLGALVKILEVGFDEACNTHVEGVGGLSVRRIQGCNIDFLIISRVVEGSAPATFMKILLGRNAFNKLSNYLVERALALQGFLVTANALKYLDWEVVHKIVKTRRQTCISCITPDDQALTLRGAFALA